MKKAILLLITVCCAVSLHAQFGPQQIISDDIYLASHAIPYDLDNDGYIDIISSDYDEDNIYWHQNMDGEGDFSDKQIIVDNEYSMLDIKLVDMDNDGYKDLIYNTNHLDKIAWLKNLNGTGDFGTEQIVSQEPFAYNFSISDIDHDNDNDILAVLFNGQFGELLVWFENIDGLGSFSPFQIIDDELFGEYSLLDTVDLDSDGDIDIVTGYERFSSPGKVVWYENINSSGVFQERQNIYDFPSFSDNTSIGYVIPAHINGDSYIDLIIDTVHSDTDDYIYWLEHLDGQGMFSTPQLIHIKETGLGSMNVFDIDADGDNDILVSFYQEPHSAIVWFDNLNGNGSFTKRVISTELTRATDANAADFSGDGLLDVVSSSSLDSKVAWYENTGILAVQDPIDNHFSIYPNPTRGSIEVSSERQISQLEVYDSQSRKTKSFKNTNTVHLDGLANGIYFVNITDSEGASEIHKIIKQ